MMSAIVWKEYRENRMVWVVLALLGTVLYLGPSILILSMRLTGWFRPGPPDTSFRASAISFIAVFLVGVYGLVSGAMMLAGERENGTLRYLDALPGFRRRVWLGKLAAGVLLVLAQSAFLMILIAAASRFENYLEVGLTLGGMVLAGLYGLCWGMFFSSFGRSVVNAALLASAGQVVLYFLALVETEFVSGWISMVYGSPPMTHLGVYFLIFFTITAPVALLGSVFVFTRLDRRRLWAPTTAAVPKILPSVSRSMLYWLAWRQMRGFAVSLAACSLVLGFILPLNHMMLWPVTTLVIGVLCGAIAFADEQQGAFRFLGDQRLPLGRLWMVKVGVGLSIAVVNAFLVLAPSFVSALVHIPNSQYNSGQPYHFFAHVFQSDLLTSYCPPGLFLTMWLIYGFSTGCLYGLLFRHGLASGVFALFTAALTAVLWTPSLLAGGLHAWQVFGPPLLVLAATRLLMSSWAAGRIASWTSALRLTPFVALAGLWMAGGLWYRILEIPNVPIEPDFEAFRASLPPPDNNEGGRLFHSACLQFEARRMELQSEQSQQGGAAGMTAMPGGAVVPAAPGMFGQAPAPLMPDADQPGKAPPAEPAGVQAPVAPSMEQAADVLLQGWPANDQALKVWLDKLYVGEWPTVLKKAADLPTGPFDDVRELTVFTSMPATDATHDVAIVLALRGLQRQAAGDDEAYVENLRIGLAQSRSMRVHAAPVDVLFGRWVEGVLLTGLDRWLEKLHGRADLIHKALDLLSQHLEKTAGDGADYVLIEKLLIKNAWDDPLRLRDWFLIRQANQPLPLGDPRLRGEEEWAAVAWLVPWEQARRARELRVLLGGDATQKTEIFQQLFGFTSLPDVNYCTNLKDILLWRDEPGAARAMQLKLALRWYQADNGKPADNLDELLPKYLSSIPLDPHNDQPFRYRLSRGEEIDGPADVVPALPKRKIPPGQGVLLGAGDAVIFLVPLPPKTK